MSSIHGPSRTALLVGGYLLLGLPAAAFAVLYATYHPYRFVLSAVIAYLWYFFACPILASRLASD